MTQNVKVLSNHTNSPVVWMPQRKFPGIVFQGDTLKILYGLIVELSSTKESDFSIETNELLQELHNILEERVLIYESVMREHNLKLPY